MEDDGKLDIFSNFFNVLKVVKVEVHCYYDVEAKMFKILPVLGGDTRYGLIWAGFD